MASTSTNVTVTDSTITGNTGKDGGGVFNSLINFGDLLGSRRSHA